VGGTTFVALLNLRTEPRIVEPSSVPANVQVGLPEEMLTRVEIERTPTPPLISQTVQA
jgi:hypothetical protein